jgi:hypothetical protein
VTQAQKRLVRDNSLRKKKRRKSQQEKEKEKVKQRKRQEKNPTLIPWGRKVETKMRLKRDKSGGIQEHSGVLKGDGNELNCAGIYLSCVQIRI